MHVYMLYTCDMCMHVYIYRDALHPTLKTSRAASSKLGSQNIRFQEASNAKSTVHCSNAFVLVLLCSRHRPCCPRCHVTCSSCSGSIGLNCSRIRRPKQQKHLWARYQLKSGVCHLGSNCGFCHCLHEKPEAVVAEVAGAS